MKWFRLSIMTRLKADIDISKQWFCERLLLAQSGR
jgi:hypothetical protein